MKTILIATDFSTAAQNATEYAADMAIAANAGLFLLHIYQLPVNYGEVPFAINPEEMMKDAEKKLTELKGLLIRKTNGHLKIETEVREGVFIRELKTVCESIKPYAVVIGSQGTTATEQFLFGSQAVFAMKHLVWPLITVPPGVKFSSIKKIGLACDFDKVADTIPFDEIKLLVNDFHAELHILNVGKKNINDPALVFESGILQDMLSVAEPNFHFIANEHTDEGIIDFAEENQIDLLIVLPKRHALLEKIIHKSHTKQLVLYSHVPVMALHQ